MKIILHKNAKVSIILFEPKFLGDLFKNKSCKKAPITIELHSGIVWYGRTNDWMPYASLFGIKEFDENNNS